MSAGGAAPADDDVIDRVPCRCGKLAEAVTVQRGDEIMCQLRCVRGAFVPAGAEKDAR